MILYRVVSKNKEITIDKSKGINTFKYLDGVDYLHFFILPENAKVFKLLRYDNEREDSIVYKCDIPYQLIKDNFGCGMYRWFSPRKHTPFLEVRIKKDNFRDDFIVEKSSYVKDEWFNEEIYNRFLASCVDSCEPVNILNFNPLEVQLNENFNFLDYFFKEDLVKNEIQISNYPKPVDIKNIEYLKYTTSTNTNKLKTILCKIRDSLLKNKKIERNIKEKETNKRL